LVIVFFIDGRIQWGTYTLIYTLSFVLAFGCMLTLLLHYFEVPKESRGGPWTNMVTSNAFLAQISVCCANIVRFTSKLLPLYSLILCLPSTVIRVARLILAESSLILIASCLSVSPMFFDRHPRRSIWQITPITAQSPVFP
uniref:Aa_trans domain-containing protein n=1 Tax=Haemonchus placei TaxID=6290 RepID=A0A0N4VW73_HAEPC